MLCWGWLHDSGRLGVCAPRGNSQIEDCMAVLQKVYSSDLTVSKSFTPLYWAHLARRCCVDCLYLMRLHMMPNPVGARQWYLGTKYT